MDGWAMGRGRPQGQVAEDLLDHCWLLDEGDDAHGTCAAGTHERIHFVDLLDEARPGHFRGRWNQRLCLRATTNYWVNAMDGQPYLYVNEEVDPGLIATLRQDAAIFSLPPVILPGYCPVLFVFFARLAIVCGSDSVSQIFGGLCSMDRRTRWRSAAINAEHDGSVDFQQASTLLVEAADYK